MAQGLHTIPNGSDVFIDANVFIYGLTAQSAQCKAFLERCSREEITGITLFECANDATHQFMRAEAVQKGHCASQATRYLSQHPEVVRQLTDYWTNTQRLLALNLLFVPIEMKIVTGAQPERANAGLLTNDSIIAAAMRDFGVLSIATNDRQFDAVPGITVFSPTDIP
jgi:predicted nucleic acid-binding protein